MSLIGRDLRKNVQRPVDGSGGSNEHNNVRYAIEDDGAFRIDAYDEAPAFSSFLPGIAGVEGVPLWCMYVNRAQAVVSFGIESKDHSIAEFLPTPWAYQLVGVQGFRTFCIIDGDYYEPFQSHQLVSRENLSRSMWVSPDRINLCETGHESGLTFSVEYFSPVNQPLGSLVRRVTITNTSAASRSVSMLDGLPVLVPSGISDVGAKTLRRIHEAYATVSLAGPGVTYYRTRVETHDEAEVVPVEHGNFYAAWVTAGNSLRAIEPVVDPDAVFGSGHDLISPRLFAKNGRIDRSAQTWENRLPCALVPHEDELGPGESVTMLALIGHAPNKSLLTDWLQCFQDPSDFDSASADSARLVSSVTAPAWTASSSPELDAYSRQNILDNVLRGGVPLMLPSADGPTPLHLYSRRHGDLERDYNFFVLPPFPLSSGAGNYRDICQNRRSDVWFDAAVADSAIRMFVELLQPDGFNPLGVEGYKWVLPQDVDAAAHCPPSDEAACAAFREIVERPFHPGELLNWSRLHDADVKEPMVWLSSVLENCNRVLVAGGHEGGYWVDHWTYIVDLLESYAAIYPDRVNNMLTRDAELSWFDGGARVNPRREKYVARSQGPRQLHAVVDRPVNETLLPPATVLGKLCALVAVKAVSFDFECRGLEMEAGRPGWNDSLNGLPGLFGSSSCEAAELARLAEWLQQNLPSNAATVLPVEVAELIDAVVEDLEVAAYSWDRAASIRESFCERVYDNPAGTTRDVSRDQLERLLSGAAKRAREAVSRSIDPDTGLCHTYFIGEAVQEEDGKPSTESGETVSPDVRAFQQKPLPLYLEGQVHYLRLLSDPEEARKIYREVRGSALFDQKLDMYKLNENLVDCSPEIGRARTFTRGWYENESIWLHMSYKYLLELLRNGLYDEFFEDAGTMLVPFMDPAVYGRSILENSSFLGSSANPDESTHGRGFVARLSGSTAEFIHVWLCLTMGEHPFRLADEELRFGVKPVLPKEWFLRDSKLVEWKGKRVELESQSFACAALGSILLVYKNPSMRNTFGPDAVAPVRYILDGTETFEGPTLGSKEAERIRRREVQRIDVELG